MNRYTSAQRRHAIRTPSTRRSGHAPLRTKVEAILSLTHPAKPCDRRTFSPRRRSISANSVRAFVGPLASAKLQTSSGQRVKCPRARVVIDKMQNSSDARGDFPPTTGAQTLQRNQTINTTHITQPTHSTTRHSSLSWRLHHTHLSPFTTTFYHWGDVPERTSPLAPSLA